jgi:hypothetical protein
MGRRPHKHDISIGQDRWIHFGDLAGGQTRALNIDPHLAPVLPFLRTLETECDVHCCGIDAFGLWPKQIEQAVVTLNQRERDKLAIKLRDVLGEVEKLPSDTVVSKHLNQYFRKPVFLEVLAHIYGVVEGAAHSTAGSAEPDAAADQSRKGGFA